MLSPQDIQAFQPQQKLPVGEETPWNRRQRLQASLTRPSQQRTEVPQPRTTRIEYIRVGQERINNAAFRRDRQAAMHRAVFVSMAMQGLAPSDMALADDFLRESQRPW